MQAYYKDPSPQGDTCRAATSYDYIENILKVKREFCNASAPWNDSTKGTEDVASNAIAMHE